MNNNYTVYMHKNKINGKRYVGITCTTLRKRWNSGKGYKNNKHFWYAIQKYGWDNFEHSIIAIHLTLEQASGIEKMLIRDWGLLDHSKGYNIASGGSNGYSCAGKTEGEMKEIGQKISESLKGKHHTEETRKKISESQKGKHHTDETRKKQSESAKGKHHTEEIRKKLSESHKGILVGEKNGMYGRTGENNPSSKAVIAFTDSGSYYKEFACAREAGRELGVNSSSICNCVKGKTKSAGKYKGEKLRWKYKE